MKRFLSSLFILIVFSLASAQSHFDGPKLQGYMTAPGVPPAETFMFDSTASIARYLPMYASAPNCVRPGQLYWDTSLVAAQVCSVIGSPGTWLSLTTGGPFISTARLINTTSPITGGGDLSADRTIACATCDNSAAALTLNQLVIGQGVHATAALGSLGSATTVLHGGAGAPSFGAVANADLTNSSVTVNGTTNQINGGGAVSLGGTLTLSTPQNIHTGATPQFLRLGLNQAADATASLAATQTALGAASTDGFILQ